MLNNREILEKYIPMAEFISAILGDTCEVVLHDVTDANSSIVYIKNGELSGRKLGGPLTDLVLEIIHNKSYKNQNFVVNYKAVGNMRTFRSASYFIKNKLGQIIGVICVNIDITPYQKVKEVMEKLSFISDTVIDSGNALNKDYEDIIPQEQLYNSVDDILVKMVQDVINDINIAPQRMSLNEKMYAVNQLYNKGVFHLKGAVSEVAKALQVSEPTIYRYLNKFKD